MSIAQHNKQNFHALFYKQNKRNKRQVAYIATYPKQEKNLHKDSWTGGHDTVHHS